MSALQSASYASSSPATRLLAIRQAIDRVFASQEYIERGKGSTRARLDHLLAAEAAILARHPELEATADSGPMCQVVQVQGAQ